ncbi:hypothetical protein WMY93_006852 [Mugilogobius chulae]|uniref:Uncharacterized protein n=1 Tax=Mugilogobius chulae TaxID=88201 RepID=A0AAW0PLF9_9GOBI
MIIDFGRKPAHQPVIIDGEKIEVVDTYKYLGVHLDHKLDWSEQARALYSKGQIGSRKNGGTWTKEQNSKAYYSGFQKRKKERQLSCDRESTSKEKYLVGMVSLKRVEGIFKDPHQVGRFIHQNVGDVCAVTVTRGGTVIIECKTQQQEEKAMDIVGFQRRAMWRQCAGGLNCVLTVEMANVSMKFAKRRIENQYVLIAEGIIELDLLFAQQENWKKKSVS